MVWSFYEFRNRYGEVLTQLPFEIKVAMQLPDRGGRGYSNKYIETIRRELLGEQFTYFENLFLFTVNKLKRSMS